MKIQYHLRGPRKNFRTFSASLRDINDRAKKPLSIRGNIWHPAFSIINGPMEILRFTGSRELFYRGTRAGIVKNELKDKWLYFPEILSIGNRMISRRNESELSFKKHFASSILLEGMPIGTVYFKSSMTLFWMHFNADIIMEFEDPGQERDMLFFGTLFWWYKCFGSPEIYDAV